MKLLQLQNGSDIRGIAMGPDANLTAEAANRLAQAFGWWLSKKNGYDMQDLCIGIGHDSRLTAESLKVAISGGLLRDRVQVLDCGLASTPAMFMGTVFAETEFDGAIMITASHLPKDRNGMKFFTRDGGLDKSDISEIIKLADEIKEQNVDFDVNLGVEKCDLIGLYCKFLREKIIAGVNQGDRPLEGLHIVVDAGNGGGGFFVGQVLEPLGADCSGSQFLEPDGNFPNHAPNPEDKQAMQSICSAVVDSGADLGIIFDTDVDRMSAVLSDGSEVNRDAIIAMMAAILAPEYPGSTIVTDSVTSDRLTAFLEGELGLRHRRFKRGYKNVINEAVRLNKESTVTPLAIETSGHGALIDNYFLDDGAYMAVRIVIAAAKAKKAGGTLASLIAGLAPAGVEREYRIAVAAEGFADYGKTVLETFRQRAEKHEGLALADTCEGVRLSFAGKGWLLLRMSLHDPLMPLNAEGIDEAACREILDTAKELLSGFDELDMNF